MRNEIRYLLDAYVSTFGNYWLMYIKGLKDKEKGNNLKKEGDNWWQSELSRFKNKNKNKNIMKEYRDQLE
ncbi:MAG: hypothetical protein ACKVTZ_16375 [Bacteroidia bacterium]